MKLFIYTIFAIVFCSTTFAQVKPALKAPEAEGYQFSQYEKKLTIMDEFKKNILNQPVELGSNTTLRILGGVALVGFLASITIFKENLFGTVPLTLLAAGIVLFLMSV